MECITSAHASVLVNGSPSGDFKLERGLRQGDPLSPFLYLLVAEGLSILVSRAVDAGIFEAAELGRNKVRISHIQYADDIVFVGSGKDSNIVAMKRILKNFELLSGLKVNFQKCSLLGVNIDRARLEMMANSLGCYIGTIPFSFLGIKVGGIRNRSSEFDDLIKKLKAKLKSWNDKKKILLGEESLF